MLLVPMIILATLSIDLSQQKDQEYFYDGMAEEIIADLSHVHELLVISQLVSSKKSPLLKLKNLHENLRS